MTDPTAILIERSKDRRLGMRVTLGVVALVVGLSGFASREAMMLVGLLLVICSPFLFVAWWNTGARLLLDRDAIMWLDRRGKPRRRRAWSEITPAIQRGIVSELWDFGEIHVPVAVSNVAPTRTIDPPLRLDGRATELQAAAFVVIGSHLSFRFLDALFALRRIEPDGDWNEHVAMVFAARAKYAFSPIAVEVPKARVAR